MLSKTLIVDVGQKAARLKWNWAKYLCPLSRELWAKITTERILPNAGNVEDLERDGVTSMILAMSEEREERPLHCSRTIAVKNLKNETI